MNLSVEHAVLDVFNWLLVVCVTQTVWYTEYTQPPRSRQHSVQTVNRHTQVTGSLLFNPQGRSFPRWHILWQRTLHIDHQQQWDGGFVSKSCETKTTVVTKWQSGEVLCVDALNQLETCCLSLVSMVSCSLLQSLEFSSPPNPFLPCRSLILGWPSFPSSSWGVVCIFLISFLAPTFVCY